MKEIFRVVAHKISEAAGTSKAFFLAMFMVVAWASAGPVFHFSNTWQLVINTTTTILTFLMVFLIQNTQNRDSKALHLKLDELINASRSARDTLIDLEDQSDVEIAALETQFRKIHQTSENELKNSHKK